ncbi:hypothetical protein BJ878DRAFT_521900 [Calycina marina]|uniref:Zn(2)-C6 fungal-type domain-containing protein n=1 Tax=Calycina marina TaxID=1763456 RepID=A0A9P8CC34_9HELO|nr:hypothetical protein BJ878DRAFT_521900 [Calycina marina]
MVSSHQYYEDEDSSFQRRYARGHGYAVSHQRELPFHGPYLGHRSHSHDRSIPEPESNSNSVRRRIPVACGRCRKRKIRCSGDPGNGGFCTNCKTSGNDRCEFLRVSSREAPLKDDLNDQNDLFYDAPTAIVPRMQNRGVSISASQQYYTGTPTPLDLSGYPVHRQPTTSVAYAYPVSRYYNYQNSFSDSSDGNLDANFSNTPGYQLMGTENLGVTPYAGNSSGSGRNWTYANQFQAPSQSQVYEQDLITHQPTYTANNYHHRPTGSPEAKALSMNSMATALPTTGASQDRILPTPAAVGRHRETASLRSNENHGLHTTRSMDGLPVYGTLMNSNLLGGAKSMNESHIVDNTSISQSYHQLPNANTVVSSQHSEPYGIPKNGLFSGSAEDLHYIASPTSRRESQQYHSSMPSGSSTMSVYQYAPIDPRGESYPVPGMPPHQHHMKTADTSQQVRHTVSTSASAA